MMGRHRLILVLFFILSQILLNAQGPQWINYKSGNMVTAIAETGNILWVGTTDGLIKLDKQNGQQLKYYNSLNSPFPCNGINDIALDNQGDVWMATSSGLHRLSDTIWTVYSTSTSGIPDDYLYSIEIDSMGNYWIGSGGHGLLFWDGVNWTQYNTSNSNIPSNNIMNTSLDPEGNIWLCTESSGLAKFDGTSFQTFTTANSGVPIDRPRQTVMDPDSSLWVTTQLSGLLQLKHGNWTVYNTGNSGIGSNYLDPVAIDSAGNLWTGTGVVCKSSGSSNLSGSLFKFDGINWTCYSTSNSGLPADFTNVIIGGTEGNIWVGTIDGMSGFDGNIWTAYPTGNSGLPDNSTIRVCFAPNNVKWIACGAPGMSGVQYGGLASFNNENWNAFSTTNSGLKSSYVGIAMPDSDKVWIAYQGWPGGLSCLQGNNWTWYKDSVSNLPYYTFDLKVDPATHDVWFAGGLGFGKFNGTDWTVYNSSNSPFPGNAAHGITIDPQGNVWVACSEEFQTTGGLIKFDGQNFTLFQKSNSALPSDAVEDVLADLSGNIWISTMHPGLVKFDGTTFTVFDTARGAPNCWFNRIARDSQGNIWGVSWDKIAMFDEQNWLVYDIPELCYSYRPGIGIDAYDNIWISGVLSGVYVFNPGGIILGTEPPLPSADKKNFKIFPNPAKDEFTVDLPVNLQNDQILYFNLFNTYGTAVLCTTIKSSTRTVVINCENLIAGLYFYSITTPSGHLYSGKVLISK